MRHVSIKQAMQYVADHPEVEHDNLITLPVHELVVRTLFEIANSPTQVNSRAMSRANAARSIILKRLVGKRRAGSHPATHKKVDLKIMDLTGGEIES